MGVLQKGSGVYTRSSMTDSSYKNQCCAEPRYRGGRTCANCGSIRITMEYEQEAGHVELSTTEKEPVSDWEATLRRGIAMTLEADKNDLRRADAIVVVVRHILLSERNRMVDEARQIVLSNHYGLEEWFAHNDATAANFLEAHQASMRTRNEILNQLSAITIIRKDIREV